MKDRAIRIQQRTRAMRKARKIAALWHPRDPALAEKAAQRIRDNRTPCSCEMCRNPRTAKHTRGKSKLTLQELRAECVFVPGQ